jgi:hypothetical protein
MKGNKKRFAVSGFYSGSNGLLLMLLPNFPEPDPPTAGKYFRSHPIRFPLPIFLIARACYWDP